MRRSIWFGLVGASALGLILACSKDDPLIAVGGTPQTALERDTQVRWVIEMDPSTNTARLAFPVDPTPQVLAPGADPAATAATFIAKYPETFGVGSAADLELREAAVDAFGVTHVLFSQKANGVPVKFARMAVHFDAQGGVDHVSGPFYPELARVAAQTPAFDAAGALSRARAALPRFTVAPDGNAVAGPSLDAKTGKLLLQYDVPVTLDGRPSRVHLDALT